MSLKMPLCVYCTALVILSFIGVSVATSADGAGLDTQLPRRHGDPCGTSADSSLVCCLGVPESTLISRDEECCNGRPVGRNQMCCSDVTSVAVASPTHDACCLNPDTLRGVTYDSRRHYCDRDTGRVRPFPRFRHFSSLSASSSSSSSSFPRPLPRFLLLSSSSSSSSSSFSKSTPFSSSFLMDGSSAESSSSFHRWCQAGEDENRSVGPRWLGGAVRCCGRVSYFASRQTCCRSILHDVPADRARCCYDQAYLRGDTSNPCLGRCGANANFDSETQLCCEGVTHRSTFLYDVCCGRDKISSDTHVCCAGGSVTLRRGGPHDCCLETTPFVRRYMSCRRRGRSSGGLERKAGAEFHTNALCRRSLSVWGRSWPTPYLLGEVIQIEGRVAKVNKKHHHHVYLTLTPIRVIQPESLDMLYPGDSACRESDTLHIIACLDLSSLRRPCHGRQLRPYLNGNLLTVFSPLNSLECNDTGVLILRIPSSSSEHLILIEGSTE